MKFLEISQISPLVPVLPQGKRAETPERWKNLNNYGKRAETPDRWQNLDSDRERDRGRKGGNFKVQGQIS